MLSALGRAQTGLWDASVRLDVAANNIANASTAGFRPSRVVSVEAPDGGVTPLVTQADLGQGVDAFSSGTDLVTEVVAVMLARLAFAANASAFAAAADSERALLEVVT